MYNFVSGCCVKPKNDNVVNYDNWEFDNSQIITWINKYVVQSIGTQLAKYDIAKEVWEHLVRL